MRKNILAVVFLAICTLLAAQQPLPVPASSSEQQIPPAMAPDGSAAQPAATQLPVPGTLPTAQKALNNDGVIKMVKAGLSDDLIVSTINAQPGSYDTSADALNALKAAGASGKVLVAIVMKTAGPAQVAPAAPVPIPPLAAPAATHATVPAPCSPAPTMQLSLCEFELDGTNATMNNPSMGLIPRLAAHSNNLPYFKRVGQDAQNIYERSIEESCRFEVVNSGKPGDTAAKNPSLACVNAKPFWSGNGKRSHVLPAIYTRWEVEGPGGCKLKFKTTTVLSEKDKSDELMANYQFGAPNGANPALQTVYLELTKQDAGQFLEEFQKEMDKAGCGGPARNP